jgi:iron(III) transport system substrate-binding protein
MKKYFYLVLLFILATSILMAGGDREANDGDAQSQVSWAEEVKVGDFTEKFFDEAALYEAAKLEGIVNVYSYSSRVFKFGPTFEEKYPGIKVNGYDIDSSEIITKIIAEQSAGNNEADIIFLKDGPTVENVLAARGFVNSYVPSTMTDKVPEKYRVPFLVHHTSTQAIMYNDEKLSAPPVSSYWDLTKEEWRGRVLMPDPQAMSEYIEILSTIVQHSDEMSAEYKMVFGEEIKLSPGVENAGYEWIYRLINNDLIVVGSTNAVAKAVGLSDQANPPIGITSISRLRDKKKDPNMKFNYIEDVTPMMGFSTNVVMAIVTNSKHVNAAKLMINYMMGDNKAMAGYAPYNTVGNFSVRTDVPPVEGMKLLPELDLWEAESDFVWSEGQKILEFWVSNL